jgi:hypothetical protein
MYPKLTGQGKLYMHNDIVVCPASLPVKSDYPNSKTINLTMVNNGIQKEQRNLRKIDTTFKVKILP